MAAQALNRAEIYTDLNGLSGLRKEARTNSKAALKEVAKQFEALFIQNLLKESRKASFGDPIFDSDRMKFYNDMYDKQLSMTLAGKTGIADVLTKQLGRSLGMDHTPVQKPEGGFKVPPRSNQAAIVPMPKADLANAGPSQAEAPINSPEEFVQRMWPHAVKAARELGVSPKVLIAQAALETGWGKNITTGANGQNSHNLFNIKAGSDWDGDTVQVPTMEFIGGHWVQQQAQFRSYSSYEQSFQDYVAFLKSHPRYMNALKQQQGDMGFAQELQKSGYATDPEYARKIGRIMQGNVMAGAVSTIKISDQRTLTQ